eukprot:COSAG02_NODE_25388_length_660_cov_0.918004_2_plen_146_part_01
MAFCLKKDVHTAVRAAMFCRKTLKLSSRTIKANLQHRLPTNGCCSTTSRYVRYRSVRVKIYVVYAACDSMYTRSLLSQSLLYVGVRAGLSADDSDHRVTQEFQEDMDMFAWTISDSDMTTLDAIGPARPVRTLSTCDDTRRKGFPG